MRLFLTVSILLAAVPASPSELDLLPLGDDSRATVLGSGAAGDIVETRTGSAVGLASVAERMAEAHVVLIGEEHTAMDQKVFHADLLDAIATTGRTVVLAMEFFQRGDNDALAGFGRGELDDRGLLEATGWYDRGGYRWEYYRPVMEVARRRGIRVIGVNVPREIPRAVNRGGLQSLSDEQRAMVGEVSTDGSPQHRYLISRYFGDTVAMLPPGWFENMYAAQCLWDVVMARSLIEAIADDTTVVLIVGSGHVAYDLGISRRLAEERAAAGLPALDVVTLCPVTAPAPPEDGEPTGHPMGGGHATAPATPPARFARSLADYVAVFPDRGGIEAFPTIGFKLKQTDDGRPAVSIVFPDTLAKDVGFASGDVIVDVNGAVPATLGELRFLLAEIEWGRRLGITVDRDGEPIEVSALLFPPVRTVDTAIAPGYAVEDLDAVDPESQAVVSQAVVSPDRPRWTLISSDGEALRAEVRVGELLEEVHELDDRHRVARSLYRVARPDGTVEVRYERDGDGAVTGTTRFDRTGQVIP